MASTGPMPRRRSWPRPRGRMPLRSGRDSGEAPRRNALVARLLETLELPVVVDADALFGLRPVTRSHPTVLTPHTGELARLLGKDSAWVDAHRLEAARIGVRDVRRGRRAEGSRHDRAALPTVLRSSASRARPRSRLRARAMCSRASSPRFWPRGSIRSPRRRRPRRRTGSQRQRCRIRPGSSRATLSRSFRRCSADRPCDDRLVASTA